MPRPTKAIRRQQINAAIAYKKGDRTEAYKLWEKASAALKEHRSKKRNKKADAAAAAAAAAASAESSEAPASEG